LVIEQLKVETLSMVMDTVSFENVLAEKLTGKQILSSEGIFLKNFVGLFKCKIQVYQLALYLKICVLLVRYYYKLPNYKRRTIPKKARKSSNKF